MSDNLIKKYEEGLEYSNMVQAELTQLSDKLLRSNNADDKHFINTIIKKGLSEGKESNNISVMESYDFDPLHHNLINNYNFTQTYKTLSFDECREIARSIVVRAIVLTRQDQVSEFSDYSFKESEKGWGIFTKSTGKTQEVKLKEEEIEKVIGFVENCGEETSILNDNFDIFLRKVVKDSLELDHACVEKIRTRTNKFFGFKCVDGSTIYKAKPYNDPKFANKYSGGNLPPKKNGYYPSFCQVFNQSEVFASFYPDEMFNIIRNPSSDVMLQGYGSSELEYLTSYLNWLWLSDEHNGKIFTNGSAPKGFFSLGATETSTSRVKDFKEQYKSSMTGSSNAHKLLIFGNDVKWNDMQKTNRDMEYNEWKEYLIKITSSLYKIDPSEIGFSFKNSGVYGSNDKEIRKHSKEKGLYPLLKTIENSINKEIMPEIFGGKYVFKFVGINPPTKEDADRKKAEVESYKTINEVREEEGKEKINELGYDTVLNPMLIQYLQMKQQEAMSMGAMEQENEFDEESNQKVEDMVEEFELES